MNSRFLMSLTLLGLCISASAEDVQDRRHLLHDAFQVSRRVGAIPNSVRQAFIVQSHGGPFAMAEPNRPFQSTDVIVGAPLPGRRLIFVGRRWNYCLLAYEHGGIAYERRVALFHLDARGKTKLQWAADLPGQFTTLTDVRRAVSANKFFETGRPWRL